MMTEDNFYQIVTNRFNNMISSFAFILVVLFIGIVVFNRVEKTFIDTV